MRPCDHTPACAGTCEPCGVEAKKRDLLKDREICDAATLGPWEMTHTDHGDWREVLIPTGIKTGKRVVISADGGFTPNDDCWRQGQVEANALFVAAAREGWPAAIDRALAAETELARLRERCCEGCGEWARCKPDSPFGNCSSDIIVWSLGLATRPVTRKEFYCSCWTAKGGCNNE